MHYLAFRKLGFHIATIKRQFDKPQCLGDELYKNIIEAVQNQTKKPTDACFVAGTLVHTREGLVPIEKIKVGDWVLSKPESGEGEQAYKRVTKTFVHDDQEVFILFYTIPGSTDQEETVGHLIVTANHPFYVKGHGWKQACEIEFGRLLELSDGSIGGFWKLLWLRETENKGVAWFESYDDFVGYDVDFNTYPFKVGNDLYVNDFAYEARSGGIWRQVFNLEVEDYHTYYVGQLGDDDLGVWIHNKHNEGDIARIVKAAENGLLSADGIPVYKTIQYSIAPIRRIG